MIIMTMIIKITTIIIRTLIKNYFYRSCQIIIRSLLLQQLHPSKCIHSPDEVHVLDELNEGIEKESILVGKFLHVLVQSHTWSVWVSSRDVDSPYSAPPRKDRFNERLTRSCATFLAEPLYWESWYVDGIRTLASFELVHVFGIPKIRVPGVPRRKVILGLGNSDLGNLTLFILYNHWSMRINENLG